MTLLEIAGGIGLVVLILLAIVGAVALVAIANVGSRRR